jgi:hypothetical protein
MEAAIAHYISECPCMTGVARRNGFVGPNLWKRWKCITTTRVQVGEDNHCSSITEQDTSDRERNIL